LKFQATPLKKSVRWYTDVKAWKVEQPQQAQPQGPAQGDEDIPIWDEQPPMLDDEIPF